MNRLACEHIENIELPWNVDKSADKWMWPVNYIATRELYDSRIWTKPHNSSIDYQIVMLVQWLRGPRNFILCFTESPNYMRKIYKYLAASWALTMFTRSEIADIQTIMSAVFDSNSSKWESIEEADLLILPYIDKSHMGLQKARGNISNMLLRRRSLNKPTIMDILVTKKPIIRDGNISEKWFLDNAVVIKDIFGEAAFDLFYGKISKHVYVSVLKDEADKQTK